MTGEQGCDFFVRVRPCRETSRKLSHLCSPLTPDSSSRVPGWLRLVTVTGVSSCCLAWRPETGNLLEKGLKRVTETKRAHGCYSLRVLAPRHPSPECGGLPVPSPARWAWDPDQQPGDLSQVNPCTPGQSDLVENSVTLIVDYPSNHPSTRGQAGSSEPVLSRPALQAFLRACGLASQGAEGTSC